MKFKEVSISFGAIKKINNENASFVSPTQSTHPNALISQFFFNEHSTFSQKNRLYLLFLHLKKGCRHLVSLDDCFNLL